MRSQFVELVELLVDLADELGISLCHEIHFGTIAMTADDLIAVWEMLDKPDNFCVGFDPSHFWHGEPWYVAMDKLRRAGMKVVLAHAKNFITFPGRPMLGLEMDDRFRGMSFASLDNPAGGVSMSDYLGFLTVSGMVEFWFSRGLPVPVHVEAENPYFDIAAVTTQGVDYLLKLTAGLQLPKGHFTDAMRREDKVEPPATVSAPVSAPAVGPVPAPTVSEPDATPAQLVAEPVRNVTGADSIPEPPAATAETAPPGCGSGCGQGFGGAQ
jgi:hypothetical protein